MKKKTAKIEKFLLSLRELGENSPSKKKVDFSSFFKLTGLNREIFCVFFVFLLNRDFDRIFKLLRRERRAFSKKREKKPFFRVQIRNFF